MSSVAYDICKILSDSEASLDCLFQRLSLFFEPLEHSLASEMKAVVFAIGRVALDLHFDVSDINIFLLIGVIEHGACFE